MIERLNQLSRRILENSKQREDHDVIFVEVSTKSRASRRGNTSEASVIHHY